MVFTEADEAEELLWEIVDGWQAGTIISVGQLLSGAYAAIETESRTEAKLSDHRMWPGLSARDHAIRQLVPQIVFGVLTRMEASGAIKAAGLHLFTVQH